MAVDFLLGVGEGEDLGGFGGPAEIGDDDVVLFAEAAFEVVGRQGKSALGGEDFPATFVMGGGVNDDAVPIEDHRPRVHSPASVTAPVEALVVCAANLASTPRR